MKSLAGMALALTLSATTAGHAWWDAGHMQIAWGAWQKLDAQTRFKADALLQLNSDYPKWVAGSRRPRGGIRLHARRCLG